MQPDWLDYNHLYVFGRSLHQMEYKILRKGFELKLSKEQVGNIFKNKNEIKQFGDPLELIDAYIQTGGVTNGNIKTFILRG